MNYVDALTGYVGVGTTAPIVPLHVRANTSTTGVVIDQVGAGGILDVRDAGVSKVVVDGNGNVGIGMTNPQVLLHVNGNIQQIWGELRFGAFYDNSYRQGINFTPSTRQMNIFSCSGDSGGDITFSTKTGATSIYDNNYGSQRMVILGNGNVGIGTTNPLRQLHINGTTYTTIRMTSSLTTGWEMEVGNPFGMAQGSLAFINRTLNDAPGYGTSIVFNPSGYVGIGNTNPQYPLDVVGYIIANFTGRYLNIAEVNTTTGNFYVTIKVQHYIWASGFAASSDTRIKTNIQDINDETALAQLRLLQPKTYEYIDKVQRGSDPVIGFIAQEVAEVLPRAVTKQKEIIPSIYAIAAVSDGVLTLEKEHGLVVGDKVKLIKEQDGELVTSVKEVVSAMSFTVEDTIEDSRIFVYGKEVPDFHTLDKNAIFTIGVAAVQELDRQVQHLRAENASILQRLAALEERLA